MDVGWVLNQDAGRWELRGPDGVRARGYVTMDMVLSVPEAVLDQATVRRGLPRLYPAAPWWRGALVGGPWCGRFVYFDPGEHAAPPLEAAGYRLAGQPCGHGAVCPYRYQWTAYQWTGAAGGG
jgi:hypothetical protein